tara:strand:+ start:920 stop:1450 length:531 start_codon:yes stop_codon:yes gene_type:complete
MNQKLLRLTNALFFYIIWWGCILGVKLGYNYLGGALTFLFIIIHFKIIPNPKQEIKLLLACATLGITLESIHLHSHFLSYHGYIFNNTFFPPIWIICMWVAFGSTLNHSMFWMKRRWNVMIISGVVFGPFSYIAGVKLGVISFNFPYGFSIFVLAIIWGLSIPLMYFLNNIFYKNN